MQIVVPLANGDIVEIKSIATTSQDKLGEFALAGLELPSISIKIQEPQLDDSHYDLLNSCDPLSFIRVAKEIAIIKATNAFCALGVATLVEDTGLYVFACPAQSGPNIKTWVKDQVGGTDAGLKKLIALVDAVGNRRALAVSCLAVSNGVSTMAWTATVEGEITPDLAGEQGFGWDKLFRPLTATLHQLHNYLTWAEMSPVQKRTLTPFRSVVAAEMIASSVKRTDSCYVDP